MKLFPYLGAILAVGLFVAFTPPIAIYYMNLDNVLAVATSPPALAFSAVVLAALVCYDMLLTFTAPRTDGGRFVTRTSVVVRILLTILAMMKMAVTWARMTGHAPARATMSALLRPS